MKKVHIYIDESEINGNIILGAIAVPDKHRYMLERRLNDLRRRILREMKRHDYPILNPAEADNDRSSRRRTERVRLAAGGLPEIHAAELWSSIEVFWKERDGTPVLFERHIGWLKEALALVREFDVTYHINPFTAEAQAKSKERGELSIYDFLSAALTSDISKKKVQELQNDYYVRMLFSFMQSLEVMAKSEGRRHYFTCDKGKRNEMFVAFETFETLKRFGSWERLEKIEFQHSHDNPLIQLADVVTYVESKVQFLPEGHKDKLLASQLRHKYLKRAKRFNPMPEGMPDTYGPFTHRSVAYAEVVAMLTEMAFLHCGGMARTLPERKRRLGLLLEGFPETFTQPLSPELLNALLDSDQ